MDTPLELTPEDASRLAVTALAADLEHWARSVAVEGRLAVDDLLHTLDMVRETALPEPTPIRWRRSGLGWPESA